MSRGEKEKQLLCNIHVYKFDRKFAFVYTTSKFNGSLGHKICTSCLGHIVKSFPRAYEAISNGGVLNWRALLYAKDQHIIVLCIVYW